MNTYYVYSERDQYLTRVEATCLTEASVFAHHLYEVPVKVLETRLPSPLAA